MNVPEGRNISLLYSVKAYAEEPIEEILPGTAIVRKEKEGPESVFIGIHEPFESKPFIPSARKIAVLAADCVRPDEGAAAFAVETEKNTDLIIAAHGREPRVLKQADRDIRTGAGFCILRKNGAGKSRLAEVVIHAYASPHSTSGGISLDPVEPCDLQPHFSVPVCSC